MVFFPFKLPNKKETTLKYQFILEEVLEICVMVEKLIKIREMFH
jgi:hypothetical protein